MLRQSGVDTGRWLARRLMQECGLTSRQPAKHRYRVKEDNSPALPNLLNRQFNPAAPNRVWCGDISFIRLQDRWCYLAKTHMYVSRQFLMFIGFQVREARLKGHAMWVSDCLSDNLT